MRVTATEQELLVPQIASFHRAMRDPALKERYEALREAVEQGEVEEDLLGHLGVVLEASLQSGRLRHLYGADGEQALASLFRRTPPGQRLSDQAEAVTRALSAIEGHTLNDLSLSAVGPGAYRLTIDTDRCQIVVRLGREGVSVDNVAIGI